MNFENKNEAPGTAIPKASATKNQDEVIFWVGTLIISLHPQNLNDKVVKLYEKSERLRNCDEAVRE